MSTNSAATFRDTDLNAVLDTHGAYNSFQFVLRLSPENHRLLAEAGAGIYTSREIGFDRVRAFSTYLHETIHWWQHIGSTYGLMLSLTYPVQAHGNYMHLKAFIEKIGFKKAIFSIAQTIAGPKGFGTLSGLANTIVNNHFDLGAFRDLTLSRDSFKWTVEHPLFESVGHAFQMTYAHNVAILMGTVDPQNRTIPHPKSWEKPFLALSEKNELGFYFGSPVELWPVYAKEILEGQACFIQLQYLSLASGGTLGWNDFRALGMLHGIYEVAFNHFLQCTGLPWPPAVNHPTTALFLLVCDMALNPGSGFPFQIEPHYPSFIGDVDPGQRFTSLATIARTRCPDLLGAINHCSRDEYEKVSSALARETLLHSPIAVAREFSRWADTEALTHLMDEYLTFNYSSVNLPIRVLFSHFLAFMRDKSKSPEFFCWPGVWMAGSGLRKDAETLFERHAALFVDKEHDDGAFPRLRGDRDHTLTQHMFENFYAVNVTYDLVSQWITKPGPFSYKFSWLSKSGTAADMKAFADRHFQQIFGVHPDDVELA